MDRKRKAPAKLKDIRNYFRPKAEALIAQTTPPADPSVLERVQEQTRECIGASTASSSSPLSSQPVLHDVTNMQIDNLSITPEDQDMDISNSDSIGQENIMQSSSPVWSDMCRDVRISRCKEFTRKVETVVGQAIHEALEGICACIDDLAIKSSAEVYELFDKEGKLKVRDDIASVSWRGDAHVVVKDSHQSVERPLGNDMHAIPSLLAVLFYNDFHQIWEKNRLIEAILLGRCALYTYIEELVDLKPCNWSLSFREDHMPPAPHLESLFGPRGKKLAFLMYKNQDERIDLRFGLEDVVAVYCTKVLTWTTDHRYNAFWCSHVVGWMKGTDDKECFVIMEDFCAGVSEDFVCSGAEKKYTSGLVVLASGRMLTTSRSASLLTKSSDNGAIRPKAVDPSTGEAHWIGIHQAVGMVKYGVNRRTLCCEWYKKGAITLDHLARDTGYFGIFQLMAATWAEQCDNKTCLEDSSQRFHSLNKLEHSPAVKKAIENNGDKGWRRCRVRLDSYTMAELADFRRSGETVVTELLECNQPLWYHPTFHCLRRRVKRSSYVYLNVKNLGDLLFPERSSYFVRYPAVFGYPIHHLVHDTMHEGSSVTLVAKGPDGKHHICAVDHKRNDPTDASEVQMLTMYENTVKDVGVPVIVRLLQPNGQCVTVSELDKRSMARRIKSHFASRDFEGNETARKISLVQDGTITQNWLGSFRGIPEEFRKYISIIEADIQKLSDAREYFYKIRCAKNGAEIVEYVRGQSSMEARVLEITGSAHIPPKFFKKAWIFSGYPAFRHEVFSTLGNGSLLDVTYIFDACTDHAHSQYDVMDLASAAAAKVSGYTGIVKFMLSQRMQGLKCLKNKDAWYDLIKRVIENDGDILFGLFRVRQIGSAALHGTKKYTLKFPRPGLEIFNGEYGRDGMVEVLRKAVHIDITYDQIADLVNCNDLSHKRVRKAVRDAFQQSGVVIEGFRKYEKPATKNRKQNAFRSYLAVTEKWYRENEISKTDIKFMEQQPAVHVGKQRIMNDSIKEGLESCTLKMIEFSNGEERNGFLKKYFPGLYSKCGTDVADHRELSLRAVNQSLADDNESPIKWVVSTREKKMQVDKIRLKSLAYIVKVRGGVQTFTSTNIHEFLVQKISGQQNDASAQFDIIHDPPSWKEFTYCRQVGEKRDKSKDPRNQNLSRMMMHVGLEPDCRVDARKGVFSHTVGRQPWYNPDTISTGTNDMAIPFIYKLLGADRCFVLVTQEVPLSRPDDDDA